MSEIVHRKLKDLNVHTSNPRKITGKKFDELVQSLKDDPELLGAKPIILSDRTGSLVIIAGNKRYLAAKKLKMETIPTILISGLTEEKEKRIILKENTHAGTWDFDILKAEFMEFDFKEFDIDIPDYKIGNNDESDENTDAENTETNNPQKEAKPKKEVKENYSGKFPLSIILNKHDFDLWMQYKLKIKIRNDTEAFIPLLKSLQDEK